MHYNFSQLGQVGELAESAPLLRACSLTITEGSNPSLSATLFLSPQKKRFKLYLEVYLKFIFYNIIYY